MTQLQTSLIAGMEITVRGEWRAHITLRDEIAKKVIKLSHNLEKPMTQIVSEAVINYYKRLEAVGTLQQVLI